MFAKAHMDRLEETLAGRKLKEEVRELLDALKKRKATLRRRE